MAKNSEPSQIELARAHVMLLSPFGGSLSIYRPAKPQSTASSALQVLIRKTLNEANARVIQVVMALHAQILLLEIIRNQRKLFQRGFQVFGDFGGDNVGVGQVGGIFQAVVF